MRRLVCALLVCAGCRDAGTAFEPRQFMPPDSARLTYNLKDDRTPVWSSNSDSVIYTAGSFPPFPDNSGTLLTIARGGSVAQAIMPAIQLASRAPPWLSAPALSPDGKSVAFFEMTDVAADQPCDSVSGFTGPIVNEPVSGTTPALHRVLLRVRRADAASITDDANLSVSFEANATIDVTRHPNSLAYVTIDLVQPFQVVYGRDATPLFRASWSPDGTRLVYSDGLQLRIWTAATGASIAVPNTADGVLPAWSPDGSQIAFSVLHRGQPRTVQFVCWVQGTRGKTPVAAYDRTFYDPISREASTLALIKPDGTGARTLGFGDGPAWLPDGNAVIAHRSGSLYRIDVASGAASEIPGTSFAFEPAVSRDARWLAFARPVAPGNYDIWSVSL